MSLASSRRWSQRIGVLTVQTIKLSQSNNRDPNEETDGKYTHHDPRVKWSRLFHGHNSSGGQINRPYDSVRLID